MTPEDMTEYAGIALSKSEKLKQMIDQLFDYTKLTNDQLQLQLQTISINEMINQLLEESSIMIEQSSMEVVRNLCQDPLMVQADPLLLVRMFDNLIHNAVQYGQKPGQISIQTERKGNMGIIQISNFADPIELQLFEQLFKMFVTGDPSRSKKGSGIGLAIVKRIVDLHQGSIQAVQENGLIRFMIDLPLSKI
jgi:signal transduction histidine kinase